MNCPACSQPMEERTFPKKLGGTLIIDLCHGCNGIWFDTNESLQLAAEGTLVLFRLIHEKHGEHRAALSDSMLCPRCSAGLVHTEDLAKNTRFAYERCPFNHGRFITFFQFLREKNFVQQLSPKELNALKAKVAVIHCSNCGAPIDLHKAMKCEHCQAPISVLDPERVRKVLEELQAQAAPSQKSPEELAMEMQLQKLRLEEMYSQLDREDRYRHGRMEWRNDLVDVGLDAIGSLLRRILD